MNVSKSDFEKGVGAIKGSLNYAGVDKALINSSGGDFEDHYVLRDGQRVRVASGDHVTGAYSLSDDIVAKVLPGRVL